MVRVDTRVRGIIISMEYSLTLKLGNDVYKGEGETMLAALQSLQKPAKIMLKGILTVRVGEKTREIVLLPIKVKQLFFTSAGMQAVKAKQLAMCMK